MSFNGFLKPIIPWPTTNLSYIKWKKPGQKHFRVGISVGKKIGNAVHRNWVKRRIRQTLLEVKPQLRSDVDFLVIARSAADGLSMAETKKNLVHVLKRAHLLDEKSED